MQHDTFNADFYVVAATVIPILFLALTLQGPFYKELREWVDRSFLRFRPGEAQGPEINESCQGGCLGCLGTIMVFALPALAWAAELISMIALFRRSGNAVFGYIVLVVVLGLTGLVGLSAMFLISIQRKD
jgi:hypothetical protein